MHEQVTLIEKARVLAAPVTLGNLRDAIAAKDPDFVSLLHRLLTQEEEPGKPPPREGAYTFDDFLAELKTESFAKRSLAEKEQFRREKIAALEADDAELPLPDRLRCHQVLMELWESDDLYSRRCLLEVIADAPLVYGPFKALKRIYKESEERGDTEVFGALAARFDMAFAQRTHQVSQRTLGYLVRRGWRYLRRIGESFPAVYPDVATDFLCRYRGQSYQLTGTWIFNQIFFHEAKEHKRTRFQFNYRGHPNSWRKYRAFGDLWRRSPRPLFTLLEQADAEPVIKYAIETLKLDFRAALREVEPSWVARLPDGRRDSVDSFVVWILNNVPRFEQSQFRDLGLHDAVLSLFQSDSAAARKYAASYARTHARDLPVDQLIVLANSYEKEVNKLAVDLFRSRDPRTEIGLDAWGELLTTDRGGEIAEDALRKHFGASELTPAWFAQLIKSRNYQALQFASKHLLRLHSREQLGWQYFADIIEQIDGTEWDDYDACEFCCEQIAKSDLAEIPVDRLRRLLMHPKSQDRVIAWIDEGKLKASALGADFLKVVAYRPAFAKDPTIAEMKKSEWGKHSLDYCENLAGIILGWLKDVRDFMPEDLGFEWLLELVQQSEPLVHQFAVDCLTKSFLPADFSPLSKESEDQTAASTDDEINVDLQGDSFVFTGKLVTMTRGEAQGKVTAAGGAKSNSVTKKLNYLVIGDEGSPLYGQGRKGSKQTKAESLNEQGAQIKIISETAFLQMLAGEQREFSADEVQAGCERLWAMMCEAESPDEPLARFARSYIRQHHPDICLAETDRPVDPGAEMPADFLSFERFLPLFADRRRPLREFALEFAKWEFHRWAPPIDGIIQMCDSPHAEVRQFVAKAMTVDDLQEHRRYRVDPDVLTADAAYSFCESRIADTRRLGMKLVDMHPRLKVPDELFRLTESPDANVRAFAIRTFWSLYRDRGVTEHWKPTPPPKPTTKKKRKKKEEVDVGPGVPNRPEDLPAEFEQLRSLLRRILFSVPPGRPPKQDRSAADDIVKLKPLPARMAKLNLVETLRDVAMEDVQFAREVLPLLREFRQSRGKSERDACLVAVTRVEHQHDELRA